MFSPTDLIKSREVYYITSSATPNIHTDKYGSVSITALATNITSMTSGLTWVPVDFQPLVIRIKDNGSARAIAWGSKFEARWVNLPTTTVAGKVLTVWFVYDITTLKFGCVSSVQEV